MGATARGLHEHGPSLGFLLEKNVEFATFWREALSETILDGEARSSGGSHGTLGRNHALGRTPVISPVTPRGNFLSPTGKTYLGREETGVAIFFLL